MNQFTISLSVAALIVSAVASLAQTTSPYAGQEQRSIKALSDREISDLTEARGMGLAKAAELNSYPGPLHVLELANVLDLADTQRAATQSLYATMRERARPLGLRIIEAERDLDQAFVDGTVNTTELRSRLSAIATLQGELRSVHLEVHLAQRAVLTPQQVAKYDALRGYHTNVAEPPRHQRKEHWRR
jgi:Spy/CpxP family protein refolding chaperone